MNFSAVKAVIFDFDGTLYDNTGIARHIILSRPLDMFKFGKERRLRKMLVGRDFENSENFYKAYYARGAQLFRTTSGRFADWYNNIYMNAMLSALRKKRYAAHCGIKECFYVLTEKGIKIAMYSDYPLVEERMGAIGIDAETIGMISAIYTSETLGCLKPAPRAFLQIAADLKAKPKECLVVGDRADTDGQGARNAGMKFIQIKTKKTRAAKDSPDIMDWKDFAAMTASAPQ